MTGVRNAPPLSILLAFDGSEHSLAAVALLCDLPLHADSRISLLAIFPPSLAADHAPLRDALGQTEAYLKGRGLQVEAELSAGYPEEKVIERGELLRPDLILMGAIGLRATFGILLGGVAQQVVEYSDWPVLVVRAPYRGLRRALLLIDGSLNSQRAVDYLAKFPLPADSELQVMHVLPPLAYPAIPSGPRGPAGPPTAPAARDAIPQASRQADERQGQALIDHTLAGLRSAGLTAQGLLRRGDAATEIIQHIRDWQVDLLIAGARGLTPARDWRLGSLARKLVHYAGCSALIVK